MKVLFLTNIPSPYRVDFFNELGKYVELTVLFERRSALDRDEKWKARGASAYTEVYLKSLKSNVDTAFCPEVIRYLNKKKYDFFLIGGYSTPTAMLAIEYLRFKRIPFLLNADGGCVRQEKAYQYKIKKHFISKAAYWLSTGKVTDEYFMHYGAVQSRIFRYPFSSVREKEILKECVSTEKKEKLRRQLNINESSVVLSIGQFIPRKGFDVLIKAASKLEKNIGVYIIGGVPTEEYQKLVQEYPCENVHFLSFQTKEELTLYYQAANLFVLPTREDIWGLVINEAMAHGLPVITTNKCVAGLELVRDGVNGYIIPPDEPDSLAIKINDTLKAERMGNESLKIIGKYTIENIAKIHYDILKKLS